MNFFASIITCALSIALCQSCEKNVISDDSDEESSIKIDYVESFEDFANPERGFYKYSETRTSNYKPLSESTLKAYRKLSGSSGASYKTYNTLVFRYFVLDEFTNSEISPEILSLIENDFQVARNAGSKLIPRFCYTTSANGGDCPEDFICPPYGDAPKDIVLQHIQQLAPIINNNVDVILCLQMGFFGTWGENYYSDYFGDPSSNGGVFKLLDENWQDRIDVLQLMLDLVSKELMIQVRYPQKKQRTIYGIDALTNSPALTEMEAFSGSDKARIGFHNDCLFASPDDFGTYEDYGNSSSDRKSDIGNLKSYFAKDSKYVLVGGETCYDGYSPQNDCSPIGMADTDLRKLNYTYLNMDYNNQVNNDWVDGGCMDSIINHLGYRFVLQNITFDAFSNSNQNFNIEINLKNVGYATLTKERPVYLVLRNDASKEEHKFLLETDVRKWSSNVRIEQIIDIDNKLSKGEYECFLFMPDGNDSISERTEYAIRLANIDIWEESTGYNILNHTLIIP